MKSWLIPMAAGFGAGILSAWGVGGGTLLLLVAGTGGAAIRYPLGHTGCGGRCTGGDGGGHSGTAAAVRGVSAAGGRRQPAAAMAGTKAKIAANSGNKMYTICLLSVNIRRFAV